MPTDRDASRLDATLRSSASMSSEEYNEIWRISFAACSTLRTCWRGRLRRRRIGVRLWTRSRRGWLGRRTAEKWEGERGQPRGGHGALGQGCRSTRREVEKGRVEEAEQSREDWGPEAAPHDQPWNPESDGSHAALFQRSPTCGQGSEALSMPVLWSGGTGDEEIGLDIFTVKDVFDKPYQILHILCLGTCFHVGESLGQSQGVPSSRRCLEILLRSWIGWAGQPRSILVDRGTHNRGIFMAEMEKRGCRFKLAALEAPYQLGKVERQGGVLKGMMKRVINAENVSGELEVQMVLAECLETKNRQGTVGGFSPSQWVIGKNPRSFAWQDEAEDDFLVISDQDPTSSFNRRAGFRESAKLAWAHEDSHRRVRAAILRKGGSPEEEFRPGDMVSFMRKQKTGGWIGPARVLACEGKNLWLLHAGIPVLVANNRVRGANAEEHLEVELLNKHRLSRKRPFMDSEAVNQGHRLGEEGQVPYIDMRSSGVGLGSPDSPGGDESPKKARGVNEEEIEFATPEEMAEPRLAQPQQQLPLPLSESSERPYSSRQPVATQLIDGTVEDSAPVPVEETVVVTDAELDAILGPEVPEPGRSRREGRSSQRESKKKSDDKVEKDRSRSPHGVDKDRDFALKAISVALSHEFLCFMAKRKGKPDNNELVYSKVDEAMQKRLDESRAKEWTNWLKYQAIRFPEEDETASLIQAGHQAIPMRWVDVDKNSKLRIPGGEKLKSRLVIRGDLEKENFRTDCPTASHTSIHLLLAYAATKELELHSCRWHHCGISTRSTDREDVASTCTQGWHSNGERWGHCAIHLLGGTHVRVWQQGCTPRLLVGAEEGAGDTGSHGDWSCLLRAHRWGRDLWTAMFARGWSTVGRQSSTGWASIWYPKLHKLHRSHERTHRTPYPCRRCESTILCFRSDPEPYRRRCEIILCSRSDHISSLRDHNCIDYAIEPCIYSLRDHNLWSLRAEKCRCRCEIAHVTYACT